jgi:DNA polymerase (family 10)
MARLDAPAVAELLREFAQRAALRGGNPYRARAYARAGEGLGTLIVPLEQLIRENRLRDIPGVGKAHRRRHHQPAQDGNPPNP